MTTVVRHIPLQLKTFDKDFKNEKLVGLVMTEREMVVDLKGADNFLLNSGAFHLLARTRSIGSCKVTETI